METNERRPAGAASDATGVVKNDSTTGRSRSDEYALTQGGVVDLVALVKDSTRPRFDTYNAGWSAGWDAATAFYRPRLDNLEAENDRLYLRAYNSAAEVKRILTARANAGLAEHADRWLAGEVS